MIDKTKIELIVYDFDGVMTNNKVLLTEDGREGVYVNRSDGLAVNIIKQYGIPQIILSSEQNKIVELRARKLQIPVIAGVKNKKQQLLNYCSEKSIKLQNVVYIGNDINDLEAMKNVGIPICPEDACMEIKAISKFIIHVNGGDGVIRNFLDLIKHTDG
ncbi:MAG TPA: HAD hydrolase family protein [Bacteroidales bacterium]|nr:HAD hydrolase family protein [Bacteroidales bacterium]HPS15974.1 HAD hydrolase family protein [Bacteroidales bacterium]